MSELTAPMAAHVALAAFLYVALTVARAPAVWGIGRRADGSNPFAGFEPRISANLSNQFEWPLFFHAACLLLIFQFEATGSAVVLAWIVRCGPDTAQRGSDTWPQCQAQGSRLHDQLPRRARALGIGRYGCEQYASGMTRVPVPSELGTYGFRLGSLYGSTRYNGAGMNSPVT